MKKIVNAGLTGTFTNNSEFTNIDLGRITNLKITNHEKEIEDMINVFWGHESEHRHTTTPEVDSNNDEFIYSEYTLSTLNILLTSQMQHSHLSMFLETHIKMCPDDGTEVFKVLKRLLDNNLHETFKLMIKEILNTQTSCMSRTENHYSQPQPDMSLQNAMMYATTTTHHNHHNVYNVCPPALAYSEPPKHNRIFSFDKLLDSFNVELPSRRISGDDVSEGTVSECPESRVTSLREPIHYGKLELKIEPLKDEAGLTEIRGLFAPELTRIGDTIVQSSGYFTKLVYVNRRD